MKKRQTLIIIIAALILGFSGWNTNSEASGEKNSTVVGLKAENASGEQPIAAEKNPTGDIPDSQVFIKYVSSMGGYEIEVPEGWARTTKGAYVAFIDKLDGLSVEITKAMVSPNTKSVRNHQAKLLEKSARAVRIKHIQKTKLLHGTAIQMAYESNSEPNPVTNKQARLENSTYFYYQNGKLAILRLWAPLGADNIDQWNLISNSFGWR